MKPLVKQSRQEWLLEAIQLIRKMIHKKLVSIKNIYDQLAWLDGPECTDLFLKITKLGEQLKKEEALCCV